MSISPANGFLQFGNTKFPYELVKDFERHKVVLFVGAGAKKKA